jgi:hypothetical protein
VNVDYWNIQKSNLISTLGVDVILADLNKYGSWCTATGTPSCRPTARAAMTPRTTICGIDLIKENRGKQKISGLDWAWLTGLKTGVGEFGLRLNGTLTLQSKQQTGDGDPFVSNLGRFVNDGVVQRWRHTVSADWALGPYSLTLSNSYLSGYTDQHVGKPTARSAYSLWNLSAAWEATKSLTLRAGVQNLFDKAPPFSQQAYFFLVGYDPSYTDPRGRFGYVSLRYTFRTASRAGSGRRGPWRPGVTRRTAPCRARRASSGCPAWARAEDGLADAHHGGAFLDGDLEVAGHAHRQRIQPHAGGALWRSHRAAAQQREALAHPFGFAENSASVISPRTRSAERGQGWTKPARPRRQAVLAGLARGVDLHEHVQRPPFGAGGGPAPRPRAGCPAPGTRWRSAPPAWPCWSAGGR